MTVVDAVVIVLLIGAAWSGFRRGLISTTISLVGALGGAILAIQLAPAAMRWVDDSAAKVAIGIACVILGVGVGEFAGSTVGRAISDRVTWRPAVAVDRGLGLVGHTIAIAIVIWLVAIPLASVPFPWLASSVRSSAVLGAIDKVMPPGMQDVSDKMRVLFDDSGFPAILDPLQPSPDTSVAAPDAALVKDPDVVAAGRSVLKIRGRAQSCSRSIEGSGFVIAPHRVMTNAHVVAGTDAVALDMGGTSFRATVVVYDSQRDLAVLDVPALNRSALPFATESASGGDSAVAAGYPQDGPFTLTPSRIRSEITLRGPDIYDSKTIDRSVYTLRASIRPGNSGGPLLDEQGRVLGVIFGAAIDKPDVGFAVTAAEAAPVVQLGRTADLPVATGACVAD